MARARKPKNLEAWTDEIMCNSNGGVPIEFIYQEASEALAKDGMSKLKKQMLDVQTQRGDAYEKQAVNRSEEIAALINRCNLKIEILEKAIEHRRSLHREKSYFLEKTLAETPMFSVKKPNAKPKKSSEQILRKGAKASIRHFANEELTPFDARILMAIHKLWEQKGKSKVFEINMYEILNTGHLEKTGKVYDHLEKSLLRLFRAEIRFEGFIEEDDTEFVHMMQQVGFRRGKAETGKDARFRIIFTDLIYDSLQKGCLEYLSMALWEDLSSGSAQLLYTRLPSEFRSGRSEWDLDELCEMINLNTDRLSRRKDLIEKALSELELFGAIRSFKMRTDYGGNTRVFITPTEMLIGPASGAYNGLAHATEKEDYGQQFLPLFGSSHLVAATKTEDE